MPIDRPTHTSADEAAHTRLPATTPAGPSVEQPDLLPAPSLASILGAGSATGGANRPVQQAALLQMQRTYGNRAVQRMLSAQRTRAAIPLQRHGNPEDEPEGDEPIRLQTMRVPGAATPLQRHGNPEDEPEGDEPIRLQTMRAGRPAGGGATTTAVQRAPVTVQRVDTGIAKGKAVGSFVAGVRKIQADWGTLTAQARAAALVKVANERLKDVNVPVCNVSVGDLGGANGQFDFSTWTLEIDTRLVNKATVTDEEMAAVADTVYHEARHAEQWFRLARWQAAQGNIAGSGQLKVDYPADILKKATDRPLKASGKLARAFMSKDSIAEEEQELKEAHDWYDSVYGSGRAHRNQTLTELGPKSKAVGTTRKEVKAKAAEVQAKTDALVKQVEVVNKKVETLDQKNETLEKRMKSFEKAKGAYDKIVTAHKGLAKKGKVTPEDVEKRAEAKAAFVKARKAAQQAEKAAKSAEEAYLQELELYKTAVKDKEEAEKAHAGAEVGADTALKEHQKNYGDYKALSEEADAWKLGGQVTAAYKTAGS